MQSTTILRTTLGILLISTATLAFEVSLTRIFSVSLWYHFAALIIAIALLGFGASGTFLALLPRRPGEEVGRPLSRFALLFAMSTPLGYLAVQALPFDPYLLPWERSQLLSLLGYCSALSVPFFAAGCSIGTALAAYPSEAGRLYFGNLLGSALGCLLVVGAVSPLGGQGMIALSALLGLLASFLFVGNSTKNLLWRGIMAMILFTLLLKPSLLPLRLSQYKALSLLLRLPDAKLLKTEWNPISRVDVVESKSLHHAPGLSFAFRGSIPPQLGITTDGDGLSAITRFGGDLSTLDFLDQQSSALAYHIRSRSKVLILGPGGGADVLLALYHRARMIVGVELNPTVVRLVEEDYASFAGGVYHLPQVRIEVEEGRHFVRRSREAFDVIQLSLLDSFAAAAAGVLSGSETYLYTVEAFQEAFRRLTPEGVLSITRWLRLPPRDTLRVFVTALEALEESGVEEPARHLAFIRSWATGTILVKQSPFTQEELRRIRAFAGARGFDLVHLPGLSVGETNRFNRLQEDLYAEGARKLLDRTRRRAFLEEYLFDVSPTTDDRPFFFNFFKLKSLPLLMELGGQALPFLEWGPLLFPAALLQALVLSLLFILLPLRWLRAHGPKPLRRLFLYFTSLGVGFMLVELSLIQQLILFLGHPTYAISLILFSLLLLSGLGSAISKTFTRPERALPRILPALALTILGYAILLPKLLSILILLPKPLRLLSTPPLLAPIGLLLGMPFPLGIQQAGRLGSRMIPWAWGINGCASVVGTLAAPILAAWAGFTAVLIVAAASYSIAWLAALFLQSDD